MPSWLGLGGGGIKSPKVADREDAGGVSIGPFRLPPVAPDAFVRGEIEACRRMGHLGFVAPPQDIGLTIADGARAGLAQFLEEEVSLVTIVPGDGQLVPDNL